MVRLLQLKSRVARKNRELYIGLRALRGKLWLLPVVGRFAYPVPEINQLKKIVQRSQLDMLKPSREGQRILFFSFRGGWSTSVAQDLVIAQALRLRGAVPFFVTCGSFLPICDIANRRVAPPMPCDFCTSYIQQMVPQLQFPLIQLKSLFSAQEREQIQRQVANLPLEAMDKFEVQGVPVGQLVHISVPRFLLRGAVDESPFAQDIWRRFLISGGMVALALERLLAREKPDKIWTMNGLFFSEQILHWIAKKQDIPIINYETGFSPHTIVIARDQIANYYALDSHWITEKNRRLSQDESNILDKYLLKRWTGEDSIIASRYYPTLQKSTQVIQQQLDLDPAKPVVLLMTNIAWDSAVLGRTTVFKDMHHWLKITVNHFINNPTHQLVIRVHPAEVGLTMQESEEPILDNIRTLFPDLPAHIKLIGPTSNLSSYTLMSMAQFGLVYTSTTGLEMAIKGKPVIVAGKPHYLGKGFTSDPATIEEYLNWLTKPSHLQSLTAKQIELARSYAFLFFFRMMYPFPFVTTLSQRRIRFNFSRLEELALGEDDGLDALCNKILYETRTGMFLLDKVV